MKLDEKSKQRLDAYLKKNEINGNKLANNESQSVLNWLIDDVFVKSKGEVSLDKIEEFIMGNALSGLEANLNDDERNLVQENNKPEELYEIILEILEDNDKLAIFFTGAVFGYSLLCSRFKINPDPNYLAIVDIFYN